MNFFQRIAAGEIRHISDLIMLRIDELDASQLAHEFRHIIQSVTRQIESMQHFTATE